MLAHVRLGARSHSFSRPPHVIGSFSCFASGLEVQSFPMHQGFSQSRTFPARPERYRKILVITLTDSSAQALKPTPGKRITYLNRTPKGSRARHRVRRQHLRPDVCNRRKTSPTVKAFFLCMAPLATLIVGRTDSDALTFTKAIADKIFFFISLKSTGQVLGV